MVQISKWSMGFVALVILVGSYFALPNALAPAKMSGVAGTPKNPVTLGLDLQGGAYLVLGVEVTNARGEYLDGLRGFLARELFKESIRARATLDNDVLTFRITRPEDFDKAARIVRTGRAEAAVETNKESRTITLTLGDDALATHVESLVSKTVEVVRRRVDGFGLTEPSIQRQGDNRIVLQLPGVRDTESLKSGLLKTAKMEFRLVTDATAAAAEELPFDETISGNAGLQPLWLELDPIVTGEHLQDARLSYSQQDGQPQVFFRFDGRGASLFAETTANNVGRPFAIVLDNKIISAPTIRDAITGGQGVITGGFSTEQANELAVLLKSGALPAQINFLEERTVGASLGADSIEAGVTACILGLLFVLIFMGAYYGLFGIFANVALLTNLVLLLGALTALGATLTLPGIAGIVLTVGMAVDANVLIFERMREVYRANELSVGKAIEKGYKEAISTILDANLTTLIAAILLFVFGSGPIRGFAVTLSLGILTSMFCALLLTRMLVGFWWTPNRTKLPIA